MSTAIGDGAITPFGDALLDALSARAAASPRRRQHHNIHASYGDPCQRLLNAIEPGSYLRPYKHAVKPRSKLLVAVRGQFAAVQFDDEGGIRSVIPFGAGNVNAMDFAVEIAAHCWNTVLSLATRSVLLEVKAGPFDPTEPRDCPPWAPEEESAAAREFVAGLEAAVRSRLDVERGGTDGAPR